MADVDITIRARELTAAAFQSVSKALKLLEEQADRTGRNTTRSLGQVLQDVERQAQSVGAKLTGAGTALTAGLTLPIVAAVAGATKAAVDYESAFAGVRKTVNATEEELRALNDEILDMSRRMPTSAVEIAKVAETAGQLGVGVQHIRLFTETMIQLGATTNLTADQAATAMGRFSNIMGTPLSSIDKTAAALVALGNDGASTEAEIVDMTLRIAGAARTMNMTEGDALGLANALSSVGIEAEMGGSAISKVMIRIAMAANAGGPALEAYAKVAGKSADEFQRMVKNQPGEALAAFIAGLGRIKTEGGDLLGTLAKLDVTEVRMRDTLLRVANAGELVAQSMRLGNTAFEEGRAHLTEYDKRVATTASQLRIMWNEIQFVAIQLGTALLPTIVDFLGFVRPMAQGVADIATRLREVHPWAVNAAVGLGLIVAAAGPILFLAGTLISSVGSIAGALALVAPAGATAAGGAIVATGALAGLGTMVGVVTVGLGGLTVALAGFGLALKGIDLWAQWTEGMSAADAMGRSFAQDLYGVSAAHYAASRAAAEQVESLRQLREEQAKSGIRGQRTKDINLRPEDDRNDPTNLRRLLGYPDLGDIPGLGATDEKKTQVQELTEKIAELDTALQAAARNGTPLAVILREYGSALTDVTNKQALFADRLGGLPASIQAVQKAVAALKAENLAKEMQAFAAESAAGDKGIELLLATARDLPDTFAGTWLALREGAQEFLDGNRRLGKSSLEVQLLDIEDHRKAAIRTLGSIPTDPFLRAEWQRGRAAIDEHFDHLRAVATGAAETIVERMRAAGIATRADLRLTAAEALRDFEQMRDSGEFTADAVAAAFVRANRAAAAARGESADALRELAQQFQQMGQIGSTAFGSIARGIGGVVALLAQARQANIDYGGSHGILNALFSRTTTSTQKWAAALAGVAIVAQGVNNLLQETEEGVGDVENAFNRMLQGAQMGAAFGGWGALIGAVFGLSTAIVNGARRVRGGTVQEFDAIDDRLTELLDSFKRQGGLINRELRDIIEGSALLSAKNADDIAAYNERVIDHVRTTVTSAVGHLNAYLTTIAGMTREQRQEIVDEMAEIDEERKAFMGKDLSADDQKRVAELDKRWDALQARLTEAAQLQTLLQISSQTSANAIASAVAGSFQTLLASGIDPAAAVAQVEPAVLALQDQLARLGIDGGAAFASLLAQVAMTKDAIAGPAVQAMRSLGSAITDLYNGGVLTSDMFVGMAAQIGQTFQNLVAQGHDGRTAMALMRPQLQQIWELQQRFGVELDASTQKLIDEAKAAGLVGDEHKSASERMVDGIGRVVDRLDALLEGMGIRLPDAVTDAARTIRDKASGIRGEIDGIISRIPRTIPVDVDITYNEEDGRNRTQPVPPGAARGVYATRPMTRIFGEGGEPELGGPVSFMAKALAGALGTLTPPTPTREGPAMTIWPVLILSERQGEIDYSAVNRHLAGPRWFGGNDAGLRERAETIALRVVQREMSRRA